MNVCAIPKPATVVVVAGNVIVVESVPANVIVLLNVAVFPSATARVLDVAGAVIAILLMDVAVATPSVGVVSVGDVAQTSDPVPVNAVVKIDGLLALWLVAPKRKPAVVSVAGVAVLKSKAIAYPLIPIASRPYPSTKHPCPNTNPMDWAQMS